MAALSRRVLLNFIFRRPLITSAVQLQKESPGGLTIKDVEIFQKNADTVNVNISKAMKAYKLKAETEDKFFAQQVTEYEIGKRHLANIMGRNPETFTQQDIDEAIEYLLPSGLFMKETRPLMKHPADIFPKRKAAEFDDFGRPFHTLFYTGKPEYFQLLQTISLKADHLNSLFNKHLESQIRENTFQYTLEGKELNVTSSIWITKQEFKKKILEPVTDKQFNFFIVSMDRLLQHPLAYREEEFIRNFRKPISDGQTSDEIPKLMYTETGVPYMTANGLRKSLRSKVTIYGNGTGKFSVNGHDDILYFDNYQDREQVMFPLQFTKMLNKVDVVAVCEGPPKSKSAQAGAIRYATSVALRSFLDDSSVEKMRIAGLLTCNPRRRERKKPGRMRARRRYTWKKR